MAFPDEAKVTMTRKPRPRTHSANPVIPAQAGMTKESAGMTEENQILV